MFFKHIPTLPCNGTVGWRHYNGTRSPQSPQKTKRGHKSPNYTQSQVRESICRSIPDVLCVGRGLTDVQRNILALCTAPKARRSRRPWVGRRRSTSREQKPEYYQTLARECACRGFPTQKGKYFFFISSVSCVPYSQTSNASAYLILLPFSSPYFSMSSFLKRAAVFANLTA